MHPAEPYSVRQGVRFLKEQDIAASGEKICAASPSNGFELHQI